MTKHLYTYPLYIKVLHAGMVIFGLTAFITGEIAENGASSTGFYIHAYLGLSLTLFIIVRLGSGMSGSSRMSFHSWSPLSSGQWKLASQDVKNLMNLQVPERGMHEGLSGLTQAFGLILFSWMGVSGTGLFLLNEGQQKIQFEILEELHEVGEALIPLYLFLHVGSVLVHSLVGKPNWKKMWKFKIINNQN